MYVVYDETTTDGVTERRLQVADQRLLRFVLGRDPSPGDHGDARVRPVTRIMDWTFLEDEPGDRLPEALAPTEDAFCLADGRLLVFRPQGA